MAALTKRLVATLSLTGITGLVLAGCTMTPSGPIATPSHSSTSSATSTSTPSSTPTPTTTKSVDKGVPIERTCDQIISPETMYAYNSNISLIDKFSPEKGTDAATITSSYQGIACRWVNDSSGEKITVAVAILKAETLETIKNGLVTTSNSVPTYGVEGYFTLAGEVGEADAFPDPYWVSVDSDTFLEPGDASDIVSYVLDSLKK